MRRRLSTIIPYTNKKVSPDADILDNIKNAKQSSTKDLCKFLKNPNMVLFFATAPSSILFKKFIMCPRMASAVCISVRG